MNTNLEPTESQIEAAGNDYWKAKTLLNRQQAAEARLKPAPAAEIDSGWRLIPSEAEIFAEMQSVGCGRETAVQRLSVQLAADAKILSAALPSAVEQIQESRDVAERAEQAAREVLDESLAVIGEVESRIMQLGAIRLKISQLRSVSLSEADEKICGKRAVELFLNKLGDSASPQTESAFNLAIEDITRRKAIAPHLPAFISTFEKSAAELVAEILETAGSSKINLRALITSMRTSSRWSQGEFLRCDNVGAFDGLYVK